MSQCDFNLKIWGDAAAEVWELLERMPKGRYTFSVEELLPDEADVRQKVFFDYRLRRNDDVIELVAVSDAPPLALLEYLCRRFLGVTAETRSCTNHESWERWAWRDNDAKLVEEALIDLQSDPDDDGVCWWLLAPGEERTFFRSQEFVAMEKQAIEIVSQSQKVAL